MRFTGFGPRISLYMDAARIRLDARRRKTEVSHNRPATSSRKSLWQTAVRPRRMRALPRFLPRHDKRMIRLSPRRED